MSKVIDVFDDVLEEHNAILIEQEVKSISWDYDYPSKIGEVNKHWHVLCGHNKQDCEDKDYAWADQMFDFIKTGLNFDQKYSVLDYERIYCNAHTHGLEPHMHVDDGDFTMIYYPRLDWKTDAWGGGTLIDGRLVPYKGNRLVVFDAILPHKAMPVSRECYELRSVVVFKSNVKGANRDRLDFYKD